MPTKWLLYLGPDNFYERERERERERESYRSMDRMLLGIARDKMRQQANNHHGDYFALCTRFLYIDKVLCLLCFSFYVPMNKEFLPQTVIYPTNGFVGLWYAKKDDVIHVYHCLNNGPLTITQTTVSNIIWFSHLLVGNNYKFVYCGDTLPIIIKRQTSNL